MTTTPMPLLDISRLRALEQAATKGPWSASIQLHRDDPITLYAPENTTVGMYTPRQGQGRVDCDLIAESRNALGQLLDIAEKAEAWLKAYDRDGCWPSLDEIKCAEDLRAALRGGK